MFILENTENFEKCFKQKFCISSKYTFYVLYIFVVRLIVFEKVIDEVNRA